MKSGFRHLGKVLISLQCGAWIALSPVIPQLHQIFSGHAHVYCSEHHRIEDAAYKRGWHAVPDEPTSADEHLTTARGIATDIELRPACLLSNIMVPATHTTAAVDSTSQPAAEQGVKAATDCDVPALDRILLAPKNSPPCPA